MSKLLKIVGRIIGSIFEWTLLLLIVFAFSIRTSRFQTYLGHLATNYLSKELKTDLRIGKIDVVFFDKVYFKDVFVRDLDGDTLASLYSIDIRVHDLDLSGNRIDLKSITLNEGRVGISRDSITGDYNYEFITDFFDDGSKSTSKKDPIRFFVHGLNINSVNVSYNDYRKGYNEYGMDYDHLYFHDVVLHTENFSVNGDKFVFDITRLSTHEQSGLWLNSFKANAKVDKQKGIYLNNLEFHTSRSKVFASRLYMKMSSLEGIHEFEDSVYFDAQIDSSVVNMRDVSLFAPELKGMNTPIYLTATVRNRVKDLTITDLDLRFGKRTMITGDFLLPDFRNLNQGNLNENIRLAYIDLEDVENLRLPDEAGQAFLKFDPMLARLGYADLRQTIMKGTVNSFRFSSQRMNTALGTVHVDNGVLFKQLPEGGYRFEHTTNSNFDVYVDSFQLGKFIDDDMFGKIDGSLFLSGVVGQEDVFRIDEINGEFNTFGFNKYNYSSIVVERGSFINSILDAKVEINDPHLVLSYEGKIDVHKKQHYDFTVDIIRADLGKLNVVKDPESKLITKLKLDITGSDFKSYEGLIAIDQIAYQEKGKALALPALLFTIDKSGFEDMYTLKSSIVNADLTGKVHPNSIYTSVNNLMARLLPAYFTAQKYSRQDFKDDHFKLNAVVGQTEDLLAIFYPEAYIAPNTQVNLTLDGRTNYQSLVLVSNELSYQEDLNDPRKQYLQNLRFSDTLDNGKVSAHLTASNFKVSDSLFARDLDIAVKGAFGNFDTDILWNQGYHNPAEFHFNTNFQSKDDISFLIKASNFSVRDQVWNIFNNADIHWLNKKIEIANLQLKRGEEFLALNGIVSENENDELKVDANNINLADFSSLINFGVELDGRMNASVKLTTPFTSLRADGELQLLDLEVDGNEVGDVHTHGIWDDRNERLVLDGDLMYLDYETFKYEGFFYPYKTEDNLDFSLNFKGMDIGIANAFLDPQVISEIKGNLKGQVIVKGSTTEPDISGKLKLANGSLKVGVLGTHYNVSGPLTFDGKNDGIYFNLPIVDDDGNNAFMSASVFHDNFTNFSANMDIFFDETVTGFDRSHAFTGKFMVLNTQYQEGQVYYGKAYASGFANINIQEGTTEITVYAKTEKGTQIDLPMYGQSEIDEFDFISFKEDSIEDQKSKINLSGVDLKLNITATPDAAIKLIFNDKTGDMLSARGQGDLAISVDQYNQIKMSGRYEINEGKYDFVLGVVKQEFILEPKSSISWTGSPYDANLNIRTYNSVNASLGEIDRGALSGGNENKSVVKCILDITQTLSNPQISLDIDVPTANESGKAMLARIRSDKDELQKQFFTLLLFRRFAPINGESSNQSLGGVADVITEQINSALDQMSKNVKFNVGYDGNALTGDKNVQVGFKTALGQKEKIILKTSFGVANSTSGASSSSSLIGDMSLDYLFNEDGSFRLTIFNESNDKGVLSNKDRGDYTQGVGLHYQEEFDKIEDSRMIEFFKNIFRRNKQAENSKKKDERPVEYVPGSTTPVIKKEEDPI